MERLIDWVRQITFFLIFMTLFYQLTPDKKYQRYIRFFASLVLVILTVNPLLALFNMEETLQFQQDVFAYPQEVEEFRLRAQQAQGQQFTDILEAYRQTVKDHLEVMAAQQGLYVRDSTVTLAAEETQFGQVTAVEMTVTYRRIESGKGQMETTEGTDQGQGWEQQGTAADGMAEQESGGSGTVTENGSEVREIVVDQVTLSTQPALSQQAGQQENVDTQALKTQIIQLYQLEPEQVTVSLEE